MEIQPAVSASAVFVSFQFVPEQRLWGSAAPRVEPQQVGDAPLCLFLSLLNCSAPSCIASGYRPDSRKPEV